MGLPSHGGRHVRQTPRFPHPPDSAAARHHGLEARSRRALTLEQRLEAQRALERVRYAHLEQAVPRALLERKVATRG